jgi:hypothetical protein
MILESHTLVEAQEEAVDFLVVGDACELAEMAEAMLTECHNLTVALARFEYAALTEEVEEGKTEGEAKEGRLAKIYAGGKEMVMKAAATVKKYFLMLVEWIKKTALSLIEKVFGPRADWLKRNTAALEAVSDADLKAHGKVSIGENVEKNQFGAIGSEIVTLSKGLVDDADKVKASEKEGFYASVKNKIAAFTKSRDENKSSAAALEELFIGKPKEIDLSKTLVGVMIKVAHETAANVDRIKGCGDIAAAAAKHAEGLARINNDQLSAANNHARLDALKHVGPKISSLVSAGISVNSKGNGQAMSVLAKALAAAKKPEVKEEAKPEAKQESADLLSAFMVA